MAAARKYTFLNHLGEDYFIEEYLNKKRSTGEIAKELGASQPSIGYWLRKYNIPRRNNSECQILKKTLPANDRCRLGGDANVSCS